MKRRDLLKELARIAKTNGKAIQVSEGGSHTKVQIGDRVEWIPRHKEIKENLARSILKRMEE